MNLGSLDISPDFRAALAQLTTDPLFVSIAAGEAAPGAMPHVNISRRRRILPPYLTGFN